MCEAGNANGFLEGGVFALGAQVTGDAATKERKKQLRQARRGAQTPNEKRQARNASIKFRRNLRQTNKAARAAEGNQSTANERRQDRNERIRDKRNSSAGAQGGSVGGTGGSIGSGI